MLGIAISTAVGSRLAALGALILKKNVLAIFVCSLFRLVHSAGVHFREGKPDQIERKMGVLSGL